MVSAIKDILEDRKRHKSDDMENNRPVLIGNKDDKIFEDKKWRDLKVGQIVKVFKD
jgi:phospholipid-transporting ATPase